MLSQAKKTPEAAKRYRIKAAIPNTRFNKNIETDDYEAGEKWIHETASEFRRLRKGKQLVIITMFDMNVKYGSNLVAQYTKSDTHEEYKSFVSVTL